MNLYFYKSLDNIIVMKKKTDFSTDLTKQVILKAQGFLVELFLYSKAINDLLNDNFKF